MTENDAASANRDLFPVAFAIVVTVIVAVNTIIAPSQFFDYDTYLFYIDSIWYFPSATPIYMEPLSRTYLYAIRGISSTTNIALDLSHYILGLIYIIGVYALLHRRREGWQAMLVVFAITGPLLAMVTIRATPAYLFVAMAVLTAADRPVRSILYMILAACFHVSTALAIGPWALLLIRDKLPVTLRAERAAPLAIIGVILALLFVSLGQVFISTLLSLVEGIPVLNKYMAYSQDFGPPTGQPRETSISHYIFFAFTMVYASVYLLVADNDAKRVNLYVVASLLIYVIMFFGLSPVAALRQACFWQLPMTILLPWRRLGVVPATAPIVMAGTLAFFFFQLNQVYQ